MDELILRDSEKDDIKMKVYPLYREDIVAFKIYYPDRSLGYLYLKPEQLKQLVEYLQNILNKETK